MRRGTRREFVWLLTTAGTSLAMSASLRGFQGGLDKFTLPAPPCKDDLTPAVPAGPEYRAGAPVRNNLREPSLPGQKMALSGFVTGLSCGRIKGARVEFWQADSTGKYDMTGFHLRGAVLTGADGRYSIETLVPGGQAGKARRIHARVQPPGKAVLTTVLFFPGDPAATKDKVFKASLVMKPAAGDNTYTFDFLLDA